MEDSLKRGGDLRKPRNPEQGHPHRKGVGNPMSRFEVKGDVRAECA